MKRYSEKRKKFKIIPLTTYLPARRTCLDSLPLPISRSCLFHPLLRPAVISPPCLQSCAEKLQVCHCVNDNYCTRESCSNSNSCKRSNPYLCPHGFKDNESLNTESANENEARDAEELADNNTLDKINFDENSELYQGDGEERIPQRYSLSNTKDNRNTESNIIISQRADQPFSRKESRDGIQKITTNRLTNKDYITSNTSNLPVLAELESDRDLNSRTSNSEPNSKDIAAPKTIRGDNRVPNEMSLTGFHQTEFQQHLQPSHDLNESLEPNMYNSRGTSTTQFDKSKSNNIHSEEPWQTKNDQSNQCCLPPYIQTAPSIVNTSEHIEHTPRFRQQAQSFRQFNNSNEDEELNANDDSLSMVKTKEAIESTHENNKRRQSFQISPPYEETMREFALNDNTILSGSSTKTLSKAGCRKTDEKSGKNTEDTLYQDDFNNKYHSGYRPNHTKSIQSRKNQLFASNYDNNIDLNNSGTELSNRQGSSCCGQRIRGVDLKKVTNRESEYKSNKVIQKSKAIDCACSDYYENKIPDEKGIKCKKNIACSREVNSSACASVSCVMNQVPRCRCHYPPSFKQFNCVGNITGNCNCTDNK